MTKDVATGDIGAIQTFARLLLPNETPDGSVAHLFGIRKVANSKPSLRSLWAADSTSFTANAVLMNTEGDDVYVGMALRKSGLGSHIRGSGQDLTHVLGVGIDLDLHSDEVESKKLRFATKAAAIECVSNCTSLPPTLIVNSGYGLHLWWLYSEPFELADQTDRNLAAAVSEAWCKRVAAEAKRMGGFAVDSTFDLERVFRVPGTLNRKVEGSPKKVFIEEIHGHTYGPRQLADDMGLDPEKLSQTVIDKASGTLVGKLILDPNAEPPIDKKMVLLENEDKFRLLLRRAPECSRWLGDFSASAFDMALANIVARCGWTDQEITDLLISNRRNHGDELKLREKYYALTIENARKGFDGSVKSFKELELVVEETTNSQLSEVGSITDDLDRKQQILAHLEKSTGLGVTRIVTNGIDPAKYRLYLKDGSVVHIDSTKLLRTQDTWLEKALETNSKIPPMPLSKINWRLLLCHLTQILEIEKEEDSLVEAISEYTERAIEVGSDDKASRGGLISSGRPIILPDGRAALHLPTFSRWLIDCGRKVETPALKARLLAVGFKTVVLSYKVSTFGSSRTYWVSPFDWVKNNSLDEELPTTAETIELDAAEDAAN